MKEQINKKLEQPLPATAAKEQSKRTKPVASKTNKSNMRADQKNTQHRDEPPAR